MWALLLTGFPGLGTLLSLSRASVSSSVTWVKSYLPYRVWWGGDEVLVDVKVPSRYSADVPLLSSALPSRRNYVHCKLQAAAWASLSS